MESDIELGMRKHKSLSNLDGMHIDDMTTNPLIKKHNRSMTTIGVGTDSPPRRVNTIGITGNFVGCFRQMQTFFERLKFWAKCKEKFTVAFPYILHYYTHLFFIIIFEIIFYFKYAVVIEKELIHNLITSIVSTIVDMYFEYNPNANKITLTAEMAKAICDKYYNGFNHHNDLIYQSCLIVIIVLVSVFSVILLTGTKLYGYKVVLSVIVDSIVLILLLGIFEYCFFAYIILGYQIITMGEIICIAVTAVYQYMSEHKN